MLGLFSAYGQKKVRVEGQVSGSDAGALELANLMVLQASDSSMVSYGFSDGAGEFGFNLAPNQDFILRVSYLGYRALDRPFRTGEAGTEQQLQLSLDPDQEMLAQVDISEEMPIVVSGDTISYKTDAFTNGQERKLEDVLKKLPGFEVDEDGQVTIDGKTVEKVTIEGQEIFEGDTKIATKNLPANAVDKVQVLRNYEDISPLQGLRSEDRIALNIKLKEGKKNLWFGEGELKAGDPERYLARANAFYFNPKVSFNLISDFNNLGKAAFTLRDYFRFSGGLRNLSQRSGVNLNFAADDLPIPLGQNNRAEQAISSFSAANFNYRPRKDWKLSGFVIANESEVTSPYQTLRTYIGADSSNAENLENRNAQVNRVLLGKLSATYEPDPNFYFKYDLFTKVSDQRESTSLISDFGDFQNRFATEEQQQPWSFQQNLQLYKTMGDDVLAFELQHLYKVQDPRFSMLSDQQPFQGLSFQDSGRFELWQERLINSQSLEAQASYYWVFNANNHFEFNLGTNISQQSFNSQILEGNSAAGTDLGNPNLQNDLEFALFDLSAGLHYKTKWRGFTFRPGFNFHQYRVEQRYQVDPLQRDFPVLLPDALLRYEFSKSEGLDLRYNMQAQFFDVNQILQGLIINGYNSLFTGANDLDYARQHSLNLGYRKFDLYNFTTIFAGMSYSRSFGGISNEVQFLLGPQGLQQVLTPINAPGFNENLSAFGNYSRRFKWIKIDGRVNLGYNTVNNFINGRENTNNTFTQRYRGGLGTNFERWPNLELNYTYSLNDYSGSRSASQFSNLRPAVELSAVLFKDFILRADYSYNNYGNVGSAQRSSFDFLNVSLEYQRKDSPWLFSLEALNLLDTRIIREDGLSNNLITTTTYTVLPRFVLVGLRYNL